MRYDMVGCRLGSTTNVHEHYLTFLAARDAAQNFALANPDGVAIVRNAYGNAVLCVVAGRMVRKADAAGIYLDT